MSRKCLTGLAVAATLFISLRIAESGIPLRKGISPTRRVVIDGRSFVPDDPLQDEGSILKRELCRLGVRLPEGFNLPEDSGPPHAAFEGRLKASSSRPMEPAPLPQGMTAEHTLRMEGDGTPVDLVFGKLNAPGPSVRSHLLSCGWDSVSAGADRASIHVLRATRGKETSIVCLDETEGTFLLFREVGR
ncbi:MAG TPA: hypothetical protein VLB08_06850 [Candidatus Deferrimicrobium sp.]|nr:hypothetical protein [Candidatus Deferrimicrobium sp.]